MKGVVQLLICGRISSGHLSFLWRSWN